MSSNAGPACATCRKTCRRCDRARPECRRCVNKGVVCGGYPDRFRFCGLASRGKLRNIDFAGTATAATAPSARRYAGDSNGSQQDVPPTARFISQSATKWAAEASTKIHRPKACDISELLAVKRTKELLSYYDKVICPHQIAQIPDGPHNPYRRYILPLAHKHAAPLYAILGLSACHEGIQKGNDGIRHDEAVHYQSQALLELSRLVEIESGADKSSSNPDALLATIQILILHDICDTGVSSHGAHVTGSSGLIRRLMAQGKITHSDERTIFFVGNLAWLDVLRSFACPQRMCFPFEVLKTVAEYSTSHFEMVNGIPRDMFVIIGEAMWCASQTHGGSMTESASHARIRDALKWLQAWRLGDDNHYPRNGQPWATVADAFRHACILVILRLLDPSRPASDPELQYHVCATLDATADVPKTCALIELLIAPLFVAGAEAIAKHSRRFVLTLIEEIGDRSGMSNPAPRTLLRKVWDARDSDGVGTAITWNSLIHCHELELERQHDYYII